MPDQEDSTPVAMNQPADIRHFLMTFFNDEELDTLCFDHFPAVRANFTVGMTREQRVKLLLDHCQHHGRFQALYDALARERPEQWSGQWTAAPGAPGPLIFLSYAWGDDKLFVERLHADLEAAGYDVWRDETDMPSRGADLGDEILLAIDRCHRFVPVVGPQAFQRPVVVAEWAYARRMGKAITPVWRLGEVMPPDFARKPYFDFRDDRPDNDYTTRLAALKRRLAQMELPPGPLAHIGVFPDLPEGVIERKEYERLVAALWRDPAGGGAAITGRAGTLHAAGGLGKTTLAALFAQDWDTRRHFRDGVWWIGVGRGADSLTLQREFGRRLGDDPAALEREYADLDRGRARLQTLLGDRQLLIVLDDVWDAAAARAFFVPAPRCRWLFTTRLGSLGGDLKLAPGRVIPLDYLSEDEGVQLIAGVLGIDATTDPSDRPLHAEIVRELGGHTQAIAIAAARLNPLSDRYLSPQRLLARYRERQEGPDPFADLVLEGESRETNLELSWLESYDALPNDADRRRFRLLGAFAPQGSFDVAAARAVWEDSREAAEDGLARLVARSLLSRAGDERYSQHALLRAYALAWLKREGEEAAARGRHFVYYASEYADEERNWGYTEPERPNQVTADFENIRHGLEWAFESEPEAGCDLVDALEESYMQLRQPVSVRREFLLRAYQAAVTAGYRRGEANTIKALGDVHMSLAEYEAARARYEEARPIYAGIGARLGEANTIKALGDVHRMLAEYEAARARYEEARPIYAGIGDRLGEANTIQALGDVHMSLAEYEAARARYEEARPIYAEIGDRVGQANVAYNLAQLYLHVGDSGAAERSLAEAVAIGHVILPGHPVVQRWSKELATLRAELSGAAGEPATADD